MGISLLNYNLTLMTRHLEADISYERTDNGLMFYVGSSLGGVKMPVWKIAMKLKNDDYADDNIKALSELALSRCYGALKKAYLDDENNDIKRKINEGLMKYHGEDIKDNISDTIDNFTRNDFASQLNLIDFKFKHIIALPNVKDKCINLFYTKEPNEEDVQNSEFVCRVDRKSNFAKIIETFKKEFDYELNDVVVDAIKNQIREFNKLFSEEVRQNIINKRNKELEK